MKKIPKRLLSAVLALIIASSCFGTAVFAQQTQPVSAEQNEEENTASIVENINGKRSAVSRVSGGTEEIDFLDEDGNPISMSVKYKTSQAVAAALPSSYDSRSKNYVTSVKNQNPYGTCWAFGTLSTIESQMISSGYATNSNLDLSEDHLIYYTNEIEDDLKDGVVSATTSDYAYNGGGTWNKAVTTLANWWGIEKEENAPYKKGIQGSYDDSERTNCYYRLENAIYIADLHQDVLNNMAEIKTEIMNRGAVSACYYDDGEYRRDLSDPTYYVNDDKHQDETNHLISIVGWNDNYSKSNFKYTPPGNGAFLVKNSWGESLLDKGYMWISYYDLSLRDVVAFDCKPASESTYDNVYSYNGYGIYRQKSIGGNTLWYANTFVSPGDETLEAVGLWTLQDNVDYTINIYRGLDKSASDPTSGTLVSSCKTSGNVKHTGYYTIKLNDSIDLDQNERYAVVVNIQAKSHSEIVLPFELYGGQQYYISNEVSQTRTISFSSNKGESYILDDSKWKDTSSCTINHKGYINNARLNVYTTNKEDDVFIRFSPASVSLRSGETAEVTFISNPAGLTGYFDGSEVADFCTVSAGETSKLIIKAKENATGSGKVYITSTYKGKELKAELQIYVTPNKKTMTHIAVTQMPTKTVYQQNESFKPSGLEVTVYYNDGTSAVVTSKCSLSGFSSTTLGTKTVTVSYTESGVTKTSEFSVNIIPTDGGGITFSPSSVKMQVGGSSVTVKVNVPAGGSFSYKTGGLSSICSFYLSYGTSPSLVFTPLNAGNGTLTCTCTLDGVTYTSTLPITVEAIDPNVKDDYMYSVNGNKEAVITGYYGESDVLNIPTSIDGYIVTEIGERAIRNTASGKAKTVIIPNTVKTIGEYAFSGCAVLQNLTLSDSLETIGQGAFFGCSALKNVDIPSSVKYIGQQCFDSCTALKTVQLNIGSGSLEIGNYAFLNCTSLKTIDIPSMNVEIGYRSFGFTYNYDTQTYGTTGLTIRSYNNSPAYNYYSGNSSYVNWASLSGELTGIVITKKPNKIEYTIGENLNTSGIVVNAQYSDGTTKNITGYCTYTGFDSTTAGSKTITVSYQGKTAVFVVVVSKPITELPNIKVAEATALPGKTVTLDVTISNNPGINSFSLSFNYDTSALELLSVTPDANLGGSFNFDNRASWTNSTDSLYNGRIMTLAFKVKDGAAKKDYPIGIYYDVGDICNRNKDDVEFRIIQGCIKVIELTSISITSNPSKLSYYIGDSLNTSGMVVKATYSDGSAKNVTGWTCSPTRFTSAETKSVTVSYKEGSVTKTAQFSVNVVTPEIKVSKDVVNVKVGGASETITCSTLPEGQSVSISVVSVSHSNVSKSGSQITIKGTSEGTDTFDLTMTYNGTTYKKRITVIIEPIPPVQEPTVSVDRVEVKYKSYAQINPQVTVAPGLNYTVKYSSDKPNVATVDENSGRVYGADRGKAHVMVTVTDSLGRTASDTCTVDVQYSFYQWLIIIFLFGWIWY